MKTLKRIPKFKSIEEETKFWETQDSSRYIDWKHAKQASFPDLKPSTKAISLRLPEDLIKEFLPPASLRAKRGNPES